MRNYPLVVKLHNLGISLDKLDVKGNNVFHILFSIFVNNYEQCAQIGNYFIEQGLNNYNNKNKDGWAPIHIAAKHGNLFCLEWIGFINKILLKKNKEIIDINITGKKNWTALHLVVSSYKYSECIKLLDLGSNVFARNSDWKTPRYITNNFFLSKMLYIKEYAIYFEKFNKNEKKKKKNYKNKNKIEVTNNNYYSYKLNNNNNELLDQYNKNINQNLLLSDENKFNLIEKYNYITMLSLNDNKDEVQSKCKEILFQIDFSKRINHIIISDILGIIYKYNLTKMIQDLKQLLKLKNKDINSNIFLLREFNNTIKYLEEIKCGKINIITKINIYINVNKENTNTNSKRGSKNNIILKRSENNKEIKRFKRGGDEINFNKSMRNKLLNNTSDKKVNKLNDQNTGVNLAKKFSSDMKKLQEKYIQESLNSVDFELDDTIKNF